MVSQFHGLEAVSMTAGEETGAVFMACCWHSQEKSHMPQKTPSEKLRELGSNLEAHPILFPKNSVSR